MAVAAKTPRLIGPQLSCLCVCDVSFILPHWTRTRSEALMQHHASSKTIFPDLHHLRKHYRTQVGHHHRAANVYQAASTAASRLMYEHIYIHIYICIYKIVCADVEERREEGVRSVIGALAWLCIFNHFQDITWRLMRRTFVGLSAHLSIPHTHIAWVQRWCADLHAYSVLKPTFAHIYIYTLCPSGVASRLFTRYVVYRVPGQDMHFTMRTRYICTRLGRWPLSTYVEWAACMRAYGKMRRGGNLQRSPPRIESACLVGAYWMRCLGVCGVSKRVWIQRGCLWWWSSQALDWCPIPHELRSIVGVTCEYYYRIRVEGCEMFGQSVGGQNVVNLI